MPEQDDWELTDEELAALGDLPDDDAALETPSDGGARETESNVAELLAQQMNDDATVESIIADIKAGKLSQEDLAKGFLREADYTRKTQAVAADRKATEAEKAEVVAKAAALAEREGALGTDNQDLYKWLVGKLEGDPDIKLKELFEENDAVTSTDEETDEGKVPKQFQQKLAEQDEKINSLTTASFRRETQREINDILDTVPDLVPSAKDAKETRQQIRAEIAGRIYDKFILSDAAKKGESVTSTAKGVIATVRAQQREFLSMLAESRKPRPGGKAHEGAAATVAAQTKALDLDNMSESDWQETVIAEAAEMARQLDEG